jgi:RNA ligase (TIGR02306 family)
MTERKLVTVRKINAIEPIKDADAIEVAVVGGWRVVVKKNEYKVGDLAVYFEIDSFLPEGNPSWQFLVDKSSRIYREVRGHVLRTIKLRGVTSQGLILPVSVLTMVESELFDGLDVTYPLGVIKWEAEIPAQLAGEVKGPIVYSKNGSGAYPKSCSRTCRVAAEQLNLGSY